MIRSFESSTSGRSVPWTSGQKWASWRRAAAWKVDACTCGSPSACSRWRISVAAFSVKVTDQRLLRIDRLGGRRVRDAVADDAGLAGAGAGEDDDRPARGRGRLALLVVQAGQDGLGIHVPMVLVGSLPQAPQWGSCCEGIA